MEELRRRLKNGHLTADDRAQLREMAERGDEDGVKLLRQARQKAKEKKARRGR